MKNFKIAQFRFYLEAIEEIALPEYSGSTIRGGFGISFKNAVCTSRRDKDCPSCLFKEVCVYRYIFETPPPSDFALSKKYESVPHPFVLIPPLDGAKIYNQGDILTFELVLIGKAIDYLPYFVYTFDKLGNHGIGKGRGKFKIEKITDLLSQNENSVYNPETSQFNQNYTTITPQQLLTKKDKNFKKITFNFVTPTRIKYENKYTSNPEFHILIRTLLRRISSLSYFHTKTELDIDYKGLIEESQKIKTVAKDIRWYDWERYSARQDTRMNLGGFIGQITYEGDFTQFLPYLKLGEYIHIGKNTSFGLGKYILSHNGAK